MPTDKTEQTLNQSEQQNLMLHRWQLQVDVTMFGVFFFLRQEKKTSFVKNLFHTQLNTEMYFRCEMGSAGSGHRIKPVTLDTWLWLARLIPGQQVCRDQICPDRKLAS